MHAIPKITLLLLTVASVHCAGFRKAAVQTCANRNGECLTVDHTPNDKALKCVRRLYPYACLHDRIASTSENLQECSASGSDLKNPLTIIGHGMPGILNTGDGDNMADPDTYIDYHPIADQYWMTHFAPLGTSTGREGLITLISCHSGAKASGATLVHKMARHLGRPVRARTGFTYCKSSGLTYEPGSDWQEGDPTSTHPPATKNPPARPARAKSSIVRLGPVDLDTSEANIITRVEILDLLEAGTWITLTPAQALQLVEGVEFDNPESPGTPLAIETARIRITFASFGMREFVIYNDRLLEDTARPDFYYHVRAGFPDLLRSLLQ